MSERYIKINLPEVESFKQAALIAVGIFTAATISMRIGRDATEAQPIIRALPTGTSIPNPDPTRLYIIEKIEELERLIPTPTPFDIPSEAPPDDSIQV